MIRSSMKAGTGLVAAALAFFSSGSGQPASDGATFRVPKLVASAYATMHVSTIANLTTVLRFKADILKKSPGEIDQFMNKLFKEATAAKDSGNAERIRISSKRLMVFIEALRDRAVKVPTKK